MLIVEILIGLFCILALGIVVGAFFKAASWADADLRDRWDGRL